jgi:hypothetical protein
MTFPIPAGRSGLAGSNGHYRWVGFRLSLPEIVKTLSFHLGLKLNSRKGLGDIVGYRPLGEGAD